MKEIRCRGKRVGDGRWVHGWYVKATGHWHNKGIHEDWIICHAIQNGGWFALGAKYPVIPETVGLCTGRKDRNGVEICEGDIAIHKDHECFGKVVFSDDELAFAFLVVTGSNNKGPTTEFEWLYEYADGLEVIGNIHDNPELMGVRG